MERYKCLHCSIIINAEDMEDGEKCPECHTHIHIKKMCERDVMHCGHVDIQPSVQLCDVCGEVVCPQCGSHYTHFGISRVTGYLAEVEGWGEGKRAEFRDRKRYNIQ